MKWWRRWPDANIALLTGRDSGVVVLDIDYRSGGDESLIDLKNEHGDDWLETPTAISGNGQHYYFRCSQRVNGADHVFSKTINGTVVPSGIDLKAELNKVTLPPSLHQNGKRYEWEVDSSLDDIEMLPLPQWLKGLRGAVFGIHGQIKSNWKPALYGGEHIPSGERNSIMAAICGKLTWMKGVDIEETMFRINREQCTPPLSDRELNTIIQSILRKAGMP